MRIKGVLAICSLALVMSTADGTEQFMGREEVIRSLSSNKKSHEIAWIGGALNPNDFPKGIPKILITCTEILSEGKDGHYIGQAICSFKRIGIENITTELAKATKALHSLPHHNHTLDNIIDHLSEFTPEELTDDFIERLKTEYEGQLKIHEEKRILILSTAIENLRNKK